MNTKATIMCGIRWIKVIKSFSCITLLLKDPEFKLFCENQLRSWNEMNSKRLDPMNAQNTNPLDYYSNLDQNNEEIIESEEDNE